MYDVGNILQKDCNYQPKICNPNGIICESEKVVLDNRNEGNDGWVSHLSGVSELEAANIRNERRIKDTEIDCWKRVNGGGKRRRRRKTSKKGGSKRRRTRRRR